MAKVLLVEDDNNLREIYEARLNAEGYTIITAQDGEEALVIAKKEHPDLIISDVMMPRISGFEMLDILRNTDELKHTKIIMLTALGQAEDQARADNLGADRYLVKSQVTLEDIVNSAKELLTTSGATMPQATADAGQKPAPAATLPEPTTGTDAATQADSNPPVATVPQPAPTEPPVVPVESVAQSENPAAVSPEVPESAIPEISEEAIPASVVPQPDTEVVVPPPDATAEPAVVPEPPVDNPDAITTGTAVLEPTPVVEPAPAVPESAAAPAVAENAKTSVDDSVPQSLAAEEAAIQAQIANFADTTNQPVEGSTAAVPPSADAEQSATDPAKAQATTQDEAIESAVEELNESAGQPAAPVLAPSQEPAPIAADAATSPAGTTPEVATEPATTPPAASEADATSENDHVPIAHKRIIQPINANKPGPSLDELLAREAGQTSAAPAAPVVDGQPKTPPSQAPGFDPNSVSL